MCLSKKVFLRNRWIWFREERHDRRLSVCPELAQSWEENRLVSRRPGRSPPSLKRLNDGQHPWLEDRMGGLITKETTKEELLEEYRQYPQTIEGGLEQNPYNESRIKPIFYEIPMGSKVLDIGCNNGEFMKLLKEKRECKVFGVDI